MNNILILLCTILLTNMSCQCENKDAETTAVPDFEGAVQTVSRVIVTGTDSDRVAVTRMTPEQATQTIEKSLGIYLGSREHNWNLILNNYLVALGGIDFESTFERERATKIQTLLVVRSVAWAAAQQVVYEETQKPVEERTVFTIADLNEDWPNNEGVENWTNQLHNIYWRLFARAPTDAEVAAISESFIAIATDNGHGEWAGFGWIGVMYSLVATEEVCNL